MKKKLKGVYLNLDMETNLEHKSFNIEIIPPKIKSSNLEPIIDINLKDKNKNKRKLF